MVYKINSILIMCYINILNESIYLAAYLNNRQYFSGTLNLVELLVATLCRYIV